MIEQIKSCNTGNDLVTAPYP